MSVRVNLLPRDVRQREAVGRQRALVGVAFVALVVLLGAGWFWQNSRVDDARTTLATEQQEVTRLQGEVNELSEFAALQVEAQQVDQRIADTLGGEVGIAGLLQDLAAVTPADIELTALNYAFTPDDVDSPFGAFTAEGRTISRHAPGLERMLIELDKVGGFRHPYFGTAAVDNDNAVAFNVSVNLGPEVLTGRYLNGIPEALR